MSKISTLSNEHYIELKKYGKLYLSLVIIGFLVFLMQKVHAPASMPLDHTVINSVTFGIQSMIANQDFKKVCMLSLLLYTAFVAIETLVLLRVCAAWFYVKYKNNKITD